MTRPEDKARAEIDRQLCRAGWLVQDRDSFDLGTGLGIAIRYFAVSGGECDYILIVDRRACGVLEAKRAGVTLSGVAEQSERYIAQSPEWVPSWGSSLRFHYESTGEESRNQKRRPAPDAYQDTDLIEPLRMVSKDVRKPVGLIRRDGRRDDRGMSNAASFVRHVSHAVLSNS